MFPLVTVCNNIKVSDTLLKHGSPFEEPISLQFFLCYLVSTTMVPKRSHSPPPPCLLPSLLFYFSLWNCCSSLLQKAAAVMISSPLVRSLQLPGLTKMWLSSFDTATAAAFLFQAVSPSHTFNTLKAKGVELGSYRHIPCLLCQEG